MLLTIGIQEAKARFSLYAARAAAGETIVVTRYGKPFFKMAPLRQEDHLRPKTHRQKAPKESRA